MAEELLPNAEDGYTHRLKRAAEDLEQFREGLGQNYVEHDDSDIAHPERDPLADLSPAHRDLLESLGSVNLELSPYWINSHRSGARTLQALAAALANVAYENANPESPRKLPEPVIAELQRTVNQITSAHPETGNARRYAHTDSGRIPAGIDLAPLIDLCQGIINQQSAESSHDKRKHRQLESFQRALEVLKDSCLQYPEFIATDPYTEDLVQTKIDQEEQQDRPISEMEQERIRQAAIAAIVNEEVNRIIEQKQEDGQNIEDSDRHWIMQSVRNQVLGNLDQYQPRIDAEIKNREAELSSRKKEVGPAEAAEIKQEVVQKMTAALVDHTAELLRRSRGMAEVDDSLRQEAEQQVREAKLLNIILSEHDEVDARVLQFLSKMPDIRPSNEKVIDLSTWQQRAVLSKAAVFGGAAVAGVGLASVVGIPYLSGLAVSAGTSALEATRRYGVGIFKRAAEEGMESIQDRFSDKEEEPDEHPQSRGDSTEQIGPPEVAQTVLSHVEDIFSELHPFASHHAIRDKIFRDKEFLADAYNTLAGLVVCRKIAEADESRGVELSLEEIVYLQYLALYGALCYVIRYENNYSNAHIRKMLSQLKPVLVSTMMNLDKLALEEIENRDDTRARELSLSSEDRASGLGTISVMQQLDQSELKSDIVEQILSKADDIWGPDGLKGYLEDINNDALKHAIVRLVVGKGKFAEPADFFAEDTSGVVEGFLGDKKA